MAANEAEAARWLSRAAQQGEPLAQYRLGKVAATLETLRAIPEAERGGELIGASSLQAECLLELMRPRLFVANLEPERERIPDDGDAPLRRQGGERHAGPRAP